MIFYLIFPFYINFPAQNSHLGQIDKAIYCCGGHSGSEVLNAVEKYDNGRWEVVPSMLSKRFQFAVGSIDSVLYAVGGNALC